MKIFYHTDMDGHCAGAIVYNYCNNKLTISDNEQIECIPINYNNSFPFNIIKKNELIYIVDFSLQKENDFKKLLKITANIVWIDHHKTAIEKHKNIEDLLPGIRNITKAGCELTWEYLYPDKPIPIIVKLLGDYDTWSFKYGEETNYLQNGIRLFNNKPENGIWKKWLANEDIMPMIDFGKMCLQYRNNQYKSLIKAWAFPIKFEGYKCIACNAGSVSSQLFDSIKEDYDIMIPFVFDGEQWTISLYTKKDIDVSEIAKKYKGGGHPKAAGFQSKILPWK